MSEENKDLEIDNEKSKKELKQEIKQEKKEEKKVVKQNEILSSENEELKKKVEKYQKDFETADREKEDWKNKYYQAYADLSNTRKQIEKEGQDFKKYANKTLLTDIIPVLDSFDNAFKFEPKDPNVKNYVLGFKMIYSKLLEFIKSMNVEIIDPTIGEEYDPHKMEALNIVKGDEDNKVAEVYYKGYKLHDSLLRASSVSITKKETSSKENDNTTDKSQSDLKSE